MEKITVNQYEIGYYDLYDSEKWQPESHIVTAKDIVSAIVSLQDILPEAIVVYARLLNQTTSQQTVL